MQRSLILLPLLIILFGCNSEPEPGSQCTTKVLSYEEMAKTKTSPTFKGETSSFKSLD